MVAICVSFQSHEVNRFSRMLSFFSEKYFSRQLAHTNNVIEFKFRIMNTNDYNHIHLFHCNIYANKNMDMCYENRSFSDIAVRKKLLIRIVKTELTLYIS